MYRALLLDLDGTTIYQGEHPSPAVKEAIQRVSRKLVVSFVSSRDYVMVGRLARDAGLSSLQVSEGGARIFHPVTGEIAWIRSIERSQAREIVALLAEEGISFMAVDGNRCIAGREEICDWRLTRVTAYGMSDAQTDRLMERFAPVRGLNLARIIRTDNGRPMIDFTHSTVHKGEGARQYARLTGIDLRDAIAVGDSFNDVPLLQACGLKIAMENGVPELKAMADYVAPPVQADGLATAVENVIWPLLV